MLKQFSQLSGTDKWTLLAPFIGALLSIAIYWLSGGSVYFYISLILTMLIYFTSEKISRINFEKIMRNHFDTVKRQEQDLHYIGDAGDGIVFFKKNSAGVRKVWNTVFTASRLDKDHKVDTGERQLFDTAIRKTLSERCYWIDVFTPDQRQEIERFVQSLDETQRQYYEALELDVSAPLTQCMVLEFKDRNEVLYGWAFAGIPNSKSAVYHGAGRDTAEYFKQYLLALEASATPFCVTSNNPSVKMHRLTQNIPTS